MDRLRDLSSSTDPVLQEAAKLARSVSLRDPRVGSQQRIRAALTDRKHRRAGWSLRPAVVVVALVAFVAISSAAALRAWHRTFRPSVAGSTKPPALHHDPAAAPTSTAPTTVNDIPDRAALPERKPAAWRRTAAPRPRNQGAKPGAAGSLGPARERNALLADAPAARSTDPDAAATRSTEAEAATARPTEAEAAAAGPTDREALRPIARPAPAHGSSRAAAASSNEAILVLEATRALHHDHDAKHASKLLAEYLRRFPNGDLLEESLALAIEAKSARNDSGAAALANEYLERFPTGRFREVALQAQRRFGKRNISDHSSH